MSRAITIDEKGKMIDSTSGRR